MVEMMILKRKKQKHNIVKVFVDDDQMDMFDQMKLLIFFIRMMKIHVVLSTMIMMAMIMAEKRKKDEQNRQIGNENIENIVTVMMILREKTKKIQKLMILLAILKMKFPNVLINMMMKMNIVIEKRKRNTVIGKNISI